jgi:hypothetical protein
MGHHTSMNSLQGGMSEIPVFYALPGDAFELVLNVKEPDARARG